MLLFWWKTAVSPFLLMTRFINTSHYKSGKMVGTHCIIACYKTNAEIVWSRICDLIITPSHIVILMFLLYCAALTRTLTGTSILTPA